jgi:hypothetical protein
MVFTLKNPCQRSDDASRRREAHVVGERMPPDYHSADY